MLKRFLPFVLLQFALIFPAEAAENILYLNSTRGRGTGNLGNFRGAIADTLDNYEGGNVFAVDFVQTHAAGDLATYLSGPTVYDQIWFDTSIFNTSLLNAADLAALNAWAANDQPEFILDSSFAIRNRLTNTLSDSAAAVTINEALALRDAGGGILIGTDHNSFAHTANQILNNFGFDGLFTGIHFITDNGAFVGDLLLQPEPVGADFFPNHLQGLSTSNVPIGTHTLNANGDNRTSEIVENLFSFSPGKVSHIGASFSTGDCTTSVNDPDACTDIPEPATWLGALLVGCGLMLRRKKHLT